MAIRDDIRAKIRSGNPVTRLIILNLVVFLLLSLIRIFTFLSGELPAMRAFESGVFDNLALPLSFDGLLHKPWTLITYMFTQKGVQHILWNLVTLFWFGEFLGSYSNPRKIIPLFIYGGICGGLLSIGLLHAVPLLRPYLDSQLIGASAGVTAIVVAAAALIPNVLMNIMFIGPVKLIYVAMVVIFIDVLDVASYSNVGGNLAHLGGALMGYFFIVQYKKGRDMSTGLNRFFDWIKNLFSSSGSSRMKVVHKRSMSDEDYNYNRKLEQERVDRILDKINRSSYDSLTKEEKDFLNKASKK
ncbi:MAG: rhomboid family intramembrane serine protease [Bacteroidia bacterium]